MHQQSGDQKLKQQQQSSQQQSKPSETVWNEVFDEITSGTEYAIRANLSEILNFVKAGLEHQSWKLRIQSALTINTICNKLQSKIEQENLNELLKMLISALQTRTWTGKDKILLSVSSLFINCKLKLKFENSLVEEIINAVFKEASKQSSNIYVTYKTCSLRCLADMVQFSSAHFKDSYFEQYWTNFVLKYFDREFGELLIKEKQRVDQQFDLFKKKILKEEIQEQAMDIEQKEDVKNEENMEEEETDKEAEELNATIKHIILESLGKCWPFGSDIQERYIYNGTQILSHNLNKITWTNQLGILKSLDYIFAKWSSEFEEKNIDDLLRSIELTTLAVINCIGKVKPNNLDYLINSF